MMEREELERRVAERLANAYWAGEGVDPASWEPLRPNVIGHGWLAVAREALAMCERVIEANGLDRSPSDLSPIDLSAALGEEPKP